MPKSFTKANTSKRKKGKMETVLDCKNGIQEHDYHRVGVRKSAGPNIFGKKVVGYVEDWECRNCLSRTVKNFKGSPSQVEKINEAILHGMEEERIINGSKS